MRRPYSVLLPVGFALPPLLPKARCALTAPFRPGRHECTAVSYTHLRAHETVLDLVCRLLLEKKNKKPDTPPILYLPRSNNNQPLNNR